MLTWLRRRRQRKCAEAGHQHTVSYLKCYYEYPGTGYRSVADDVTVEGTRCKCGKTYMEQESDRQGTNSLSLPKSDWRKLRKEGFLEY